MAYPLLITSTLILSAQMFDISNGSEVFPEGTTFSARTSDEAIATASVDSSGSVTVTPEGSVTGNVYVDLVATLPDDGGDICGTILIHVMESPLGAKKWIDLTPES